MSSKSPGRPGRKPSDKQQLSFLIEKVSSVSQLKRELACGGRIKLSDLEVGLWLNPVVVLRRLTVTVGGFRIELLPGPSHMSCVENVNADQAVCYEDGVSYGGDIEYAVVGAQTSTQETPKGLAAPLASKKPCSEDPPLELGPYVNPNDVQASNGAVLGSTHLAETKLNDQRDSKQHAPASVGEDAIEAPQHTSNNKVTPSIRTKEQLILARKQLKSSQGLSFIRNKKNLVSGRPSNMIKGSKLPQHGPTRNIHGGDLNRVQAMKEQGLAFLKRHGENMPGQSATKRPLMQDGRPVKLKPKPTSRASLTVKKALSSDHHHGGQPGLAKSPHSTGEPKSPTSHLMLGKAAHPPRKTAEEEEEVQQKLKGKKPEKPVPKQKVKQARTISVDEPQLFIPDNAPPTVKKETTEENPDKTDETVWDGSKSCGLCQKHHNNMSMVGCGRCDDWFHGDCVGLDLLKVQEMEREDQMYVCLKCCDEEAVVEHDAQEEVKLEVQTKPEFQDNKSAPKVRHGPPEPLTPGGVRPLRKDSVERRFSNETKDSAHKTVQLKQEIKSKVSSTLSKKPSVDEIRRSVRDSLKEILQKRLKESDLKIPLEKTNEVAKKTERELFHLYKDTDSKYKSKYRSLMFNLKDSKNNVLFRRVLKGEISPSHLIRMSPEELASKELAAWRQRENRHTIEMIEKDQREAERRPITKITHKGEIEIESQEPPKAPETTELEPEPAPKVMEDLFELPLDTIAPESSKTAKDTTSLHKTHLFDLHCKICTGRMAPPVEESPTKVVKVATTVVRRQSTTEGETKTISPSPKDDDLHLKVLEESLANSKVSEGRSDYTSGRDDESAFLANLKCLWRGFVNMAAVAKLVTRAFPVSGVLDSLTEDLPDSIQVGGRISPQIVWDYLEKIRATGTKEVCLIRFAPETEEDEISYTLLYAYFSSRKRFGVVANNLKQVKDMYIIPLGAIEKVPHQLVPFDGPGLENNRPNLLLGLIIRQRPKRDFLPVDINETARFIPESKPLTASPTVAKIAKVEENLFISSFNVIPKKEPEKPLSFVEEAAELPIDSPEKLSASDEGNSQDSNKPLRFLPGVLLGLGGELPSLADVGSKTTPDPSKDPQTSKTEGTTSQTVTKSLPAAPRMDRFVIKKREPKSQPPVKSEPLLSSPAGTSTANYFGVGKEVGTAKPATSVSLTDKLLTSASVNNKPPISASENNKPPISASVNNKPPISTSENNNPPIAVSLNDKPTISVSPPTPVSLNDKPPTPVSLKDKPPTPVSLKDKPADMSTEAFLASVSPAAAGHEEKSAVSLNKGSADPIPDEGKGQPTSSANELAEESSSVLSQSQATSDLSKTPKPPPSGILRKSSVYSNLTEEKKADVSQIDNASLPALETPQPVPVLSGTRNDTPSASKHGYSHPSQADYQPRGDLPSNLSNASYAENTSMSQLGPLAPPVAGPYPPAIPGPQAANYVLTRPEVPDFQYQQAVPTYGNAAPFHPPLQHPPAPGNYGYPCGPPPNMFPPPALQGQNHGTLWAQGGPLSGSAPPGLPVTYDTQGFSKSSNPLPPSAKEYKGSEELYSDPWERPRRSSEDRDSYGSHRQHSESRNSKKSRHHDSERGKKHGHDDNTERSRRHGHSKEDRHGDRRGERHHSDEHSSSRHRHRHRRDSDHEKGRRSSKDSYS
ncbi:uncharacterized protein phf3 [Aplochiton taeniatus]